jgi:hypothetical protein
MRNRDYIFHKPKKFMKTNENRPKNGVWGLFAGFPNFRAQNIGLDDFRDLRNDCLSDVSISM